MAPKHPPHMGRSTRPFWSTKVSPLLTERNGLQVLDEMGVVVVKFFHVQGVYLDRLDLTCSNSATCLPFSSTKSSHFWQKMLALPKDPNQKKVSTGRLNRKPLCSANPPDASAKPPSSQMSLATRPTKSSSLVRWIFPRPGRNGKGEAVILSEAPKTRAASCSIGIPKDRCG